MSDNRINSRSTAGFDLLRDMLGGGVTAKKPQNADPVAAPDKADEAAEVQAPRGPASRRGAMFGQVGMRVLPADFPLDQLDRNAPRGTYLDILL